MQQTLIPTLHHLSDSAAFRCLWALEELKEARDIAYHLKNYERRSGQAPPELASLFPMGKSPILTLDTTREGESPPTIQLLPGVLTEGQLILQFLSDEYGDGLWEPESEEDRKRDVFFQGFAMMTCIPSLDLVVFLELIVGVFPFGISALIGLFFSPLVSFTKSRLLPAFEVLEGAISDAKPYFAGSKFGLADFNVCWSIDMASQRGYLDPARYPKLRDWHAKMKARDGYLRALERSNGYDLKTFGSK
ncbi:hypothetical protein F4777DRAFT_411623 [Nemania sp. FL0916]|nr:hypothetical protein F4777DRAFT_411623 [Nemania sp. FL0916]